MIKNPTNFLNAVNEYRFTQNKDKRAIGTKELKPMDYYVLAN